MHLRKLAILGIALGLGCGLAAANSLFFPARHDFETGPSLGTNLSGTRVATADFDGDGNQDVVVTLEAGALTTGGGSQDSIFVFSGDGRGLFLPPIVLTVPVGSIAGAVVTGQFDAGTDPDIAVALEDVDGTAGGGSDGGILVFINDGFGDFTLDQTLTGETAEIGLTGLAAAPIDNSTVDDLVLINSASGTFQVFLSGLSGAELFTEAASSPISSCGSPTALALGTLDVVPGVDLALVCDPPGPGSDVVQTYSGSTTGNFTLMPNQPVVTSLQDPRALVITDIDMDTQNDIVILNSALDDDTLPDPNLQGSLTFLDNDGTGNFSELANSGFPLGDGPRGLSAADADGDGDTDLLVANWFGDDLSLVEANVSSPGAQPTYKEVEVLAGFNSFDAVFADLDGKERLDAVGANANAFTGTMSSYLGGSLSLPGCDPVTFPGVQCIQEAIKFSSTGNLSEPNAVAVGDFDGDGLDDFAVANLNNNTMTAFRSTGDPHGGTPFELLDSETFNISGVTFTFPTDILAVNVDSDSDLDLLVLLAPDFPTPGQVRVLTNNGNGQFSAAGTLTVGVLPYAMTTGLLDNDNELDVAITNEDDNTVTVYLGAGGASFTLAGTFASTNGTDCSMDPSGRDCFPRGIAAGDMDDNGTVDLVVSAVGGFDGGSLQVFSGDNAGGFTHDNEIRILDPLEDPNNPNALTLIHEIVRAVRLDGASTGPPDLVVIGFFPDDLVAVLMNDGAGNLTFTETADTPFLFPAMDINVGGDPAAPRNTIVEDLNVDGFPDIATTALASDNVAILLGVGDGTFLTNAMRAQAFGTTKVPLAVGAGDVDGDGTKDLIVPGARNDVALLLSALGRRADINGSGRVDGWDLAQLAFLFGISSGDPAYDFYLDVNMDGEIDGVDLTILGLAFGLVLF